MGGMSQGLPPQFSRQAVDVAVSDAGGYFPTKTVEAALQVCGAKASGFVHFAEARSTAAPNATIPADKITPVIEGAETAIDLCLVPVGSGALVAAVPDGTITGGDKRGSNAVDWQTVRQLTTQVASGANATIGGGRQNESSGTGATVGGGNANVASGSYATIAGGDGCSASGQFATVAGGYINQLSGNGSSCPGGKLASDRGLSVKFVLAGGNFATPGDAQIGIHPLHWVTTNATPAMLTADGFSATGTNLVVLPDNSAYGVRVSVVARGTTTGDAKRWIIDALVTRGAGAATVAIVNQTSTYAQGTAGAASWAVSLVANTTQGSVDVQVTGAVATIHWMAKVETEEVI